MAKEITIDIENIIFHFGMESGDISVTGWINGACFDFKNKSLTQPYEDLRDAFLIEGGDYEDFFFYHLPYLTGGNCRGYVGERIIEVSPKEQQS